MARARLFTIGHSNRTFDQLAEALAAHGVATLVDVRHFTRSRANPQFNAAAMRRTLPKRGITYVEMPDLGGRRGKSADVPAERNAGWQHRAFHNYADYAETAPFQAALTQLIARAARESCAIMCAEAVWWRCHRRIIADYAITRGLAVFHIFTPTKAERAKRSPFAKLDRRTKTLRYPPADAPATGTPDRRARGARRGASSTPRRRTRT